MRYRTPGPVERLSPDKPVRSAPSRWGSHVIRHAAVTRSVIDAVRALRDTSRIDLMSNVYGRMLAAAMAAIDRMVDA